MSALQLVMVLPAHVKKRILGLVLAPRVYIVIAEHRIEIDSNFYERCERLLDVLAEVAPAPLWIDVVVRGYDKTQRRALVRGKHLASRPDAIIIARAPVAYDRKPHFIFDRRAEDRSWFDQGPCRGRSPRDDRLPASTQ